MGEIGFEEEAILKIRMASHNFDLKFHENFFQMLNCCIERKKKREQLHKGYMGRGHSTDRAESPTNDDSNIGCPEDISMETDDVMNMSVTETMTNNECCENVDGAVEQTNGKLTLNVDSSSEDEFFECAEENQNVRTNTGGEEEDEEEDRGAEDNRIVQSMSTSSITSNASSASCKVGDAPRHRPQGRLTTCGDLKLLNNEEQMYIPVTQEPSPMTEDMLDEQAEVLAKSVVLLFSMLKCK